MDTVAYMSPEQAKGVEVDHRIDIWSLGAMLYEMLSGERPFEKSHEQALIYSILNDEPKPLSAIRPNIPVYMEDIVVVLPFENLSTDPEQEYFCDGMTEEIIYDLSTIQSVRVISRNTSMMSKRTRKVTKTIERKLNVRYVLEGSVRKAGNNLRITAQLIDATSDTHLWAKKYSGTLDDGRDLLLDEEEGRITRLARTCRPPWIYQLPLSRRERTFPRKHLR